MTAVPTCPRCAGALRAPGFWSSAWQCDRHGEVMPFHLAPQPGLPAIDRLVSTSQVPVWVARPLPGDWTVTGVGYVGDDRTGPRASLVAMSGPSPTGGPADVLLIGEEPAIGLGARFAGLAGPDPGAPPDGAPDIKLEAAGHPTAMWRTAQAEDRCALVGEAKGVWLWIVIWPDVARRVLDRFQLHDLRDGGHPELDLVFGAQTPRLRELPTDLPPEIATER
ncbi:MAG TPA: DUF6758 family protein [Mycobacteriales bacterium]|nr:DUF6758 family protein [Mycobacteriales bacterium]